MNPQNTPIPPPIPQKGPQEVSQTFSQLPHQPHTFVIDESDLLFTLIQELTYYVQHGIAPLFPEYRDLLMLLKHRRYSRVKDAFDKDIRDLITEMGTAPIKMGYLKAKRILNLI